MKNIYLRKDGRFEGRTKDMRGEKTRYFYGRTREEVEDKIRIFRESFCRSKSSLTVKVLFEEWLDSICIKVKESTLANYRGKAAVHIFPAFGEMCTDELTQEKVRCFVEERLDRGLSVSYVADMVILLKSAMKYGEQFYNLRNRIAGLVLPKKKKAQVRLLDSPQQGRLERYLWDHQSPSALGISLSMVTGIRLGELCALKWSDVDLRKRTLFVSRTIQRIHSGIGTKLIITEPKSASSVREIPLPECIVPMLEKYCSDGRFYLLSGREKPVEPRTMQYRFQAVLKKANLPSIHFHALRHMFATNCVELGFDIKTLSEILGHSGVEITLNRYVHSSLERKKQFMRKLQFAV